VLIDISFRQKTCFIVELVCGLLWTWWLCFSFWICKW